MQRKPCAWWWLATAAIAAWLLWMTLRPQAQAQADLAYLTTPAASQGISIPFLIDTLGNIVVFVPLGTAAFFALRCGTSSGGRAYQAVAFALLIGAGLSAGIELTQSTLPSRVATLKDWLLNTAGTLIGILMGMGLTAYRIRPGK